METLTYRNSLGVEVKKYVLPKFQVTVTPPPYVTAMMRFTTAEICAKYETIYSLGTYVAQNFRAKIIWAE